MMQVFCFMTTKYNIALQIYLLIKAPKKSELYIRASSVLTKCHLYVIAYVWIF